MLTIFLALLYLHSMRFANYFFPVFGVFLAIAMVEHAVPFIRSWGFKAAVILLSLAGLYVGATDAYAQINSQLPQDAYQGVALYLSGNQGIVLNRFDTYAPIIFFNPSARLTSGRANVYLAAYDPLLYDSYFSLGSRSPETVMNDFHGVIYS